jgi:hypothetical protein
LGCAINLTYEAKADAFLGGPLGVAVAECTRPNGDRVRYNQVTQEFGVLRQDGTIATYLILSGSSLRNHYYFCESCK